MPERRVQASGAGHPIIESCASPKSAPHPLPSELTILKAFDGVFGPEIRSTRVPEENEKRSFWDRLFSTTHSSEREKRIVEYIVHRIGEGAHLGDVVGEEYVRRNASPVEVEEILSNPRLVTAAREHMERDFGSGELDPGGRTG